MAQHNLFFVILYMAYVLIRRRALHDRSLVALVDDGNIVVEKISQSIINGSLPNFH